MFKVPRRFVVGIAALNGDERGEMREVIVDELSKLTGQLEVRRVEVGALPVDQEAVYAGGQQEAQAALGRAGVALLIWGKVLRLNGKAMPRLYFAAKQGKGVGGGRYSLSENFGLPAEFWSELGNTVKLAVLAEASNFDDSRYQVASLRPFLERMEQLVASPRFTRVGRDSEGSTWSSESRWEILQVYGSALRTFGDQAADNRSLERSIQVLRASLSDAEVVDDVPAEVNELARKRRARTQNNLGAALGSLSERESGTVHLVEAVAAFREALKERTRERVPLDWARTQSNLCAALGALGERESGTVHLAEAVAGFREALQEQTRERVALDWAMTQNNLGNALTRLGERERGTDHLADAVVAYREALKELTRERVPLEWAITQSNLGSALANLGARESGTGHLEEAVAAHREALKEQTRQRVALDWAMTQHNLGNALTLLGERESGTRHLEEAIAAHREALKESKRERSPMAWAAAQDSLGNALTVLGERESGTRHLEEAVAAHREALKEYAQARVPLQWAKLQYNLGNTLGAIARRRGRPPCEALQARLMALQVFRDLQAAGYVFYVEQSLVQHLQARPSPTRANCSNLSAEQWSTIAVLVQDAGEP